MKTILVPVEANDTIESTLHTARLLAEAFASHVEGFALAPTVGPFLAADTIGESVLYESDLKPDAVTVREAQRTFERWLPGGTGFSATWSTSGALDDASLGARGRVFDVTVLGRPGTTAESPRMSTLESALFESGRPVLIAPPQPAPTLGQVVTFAWNRSVQAVRALGFAMPLLRRARRIVVLATDGGKIAGPDGDEVARYLERHGLASEVVSIRKVEGKSIGPALLEQSARVGSDLLVKGAFTQPRLSQMIFGGASRHILAEAALPVLMAH